MTLKNLFRKKYKKENKFPDEVRCKVCGKMTKAIVGESPFCRNKKHENFVHWKCYVPEANQCIDCWNSED